MTKRLSILLIAIAATLSSCITNDLPKPVVDLYIASLDVEGTSGDIVLDRSTYTATIPLAEETNIEEVKFNTITYGAEVITNLNYDADPSQIVVSKDLTGKTIDLSNPQKPEYITLSYFQSYEWKIVATQTINRIWNVDGQIGSTKWDLDGHRAIVKRRSDKSVNNVKTLNVRFGPTPTYEYPSAADMPKDFSHSEVWRELVIEGDTLRNVTVNIADNPVPVSAFDKTIRWELVVVPTLAEPEFQYIGAGANVIWIKANAIEGSEIIFKYRKKGDEAWIDTKQSWYASADNNSPYNRYEEGYVKAVIRGLEQNTEYEIQGWANTPNEKDNSITEIPSKVFAVTTATHYQMPNSQMEEWGQFTNDPAKLPTGEAGPCWYPFSSVQDMFWATGNPGATSLGAEYNLTYPSQDVPLGSTDKTSAYMASRYVIVKFAAGNLFVGYYGATAGTNAYVYFGKPIPQTVRPTAIRFKIKYYSGGIDYVASKKADNGVEYHIGSKQMLVKGGEADLAKVFFCVTDWKEAHCVYSADETTFFDPRTAEGVLGIGYFDSYTTPEPSNIDTSLWHEMTLPIEHKSFANDTSYLVLTFTCSGYGDYFTGSTTSWMNVDDIELLYDLDEQNQPK